MRVVVAGAGGMIGGALVARLLADGHNVRAVDLKPKDDWWQVHDDARNYPWTDCSDRHEARVTVEGADWVFDLAENMGGISFIEHEKVACANSVEIGINLLRESAKHGVKRFFFASSACVYPTHKQTLAGDTKLREEEAWPAMPEEGYGLSKLYIEELCHHYVADRRLDTRVARYHNVYGPPCSWNDGREKSPAAICRKVATAKLKDTGRIEVWGDGHQTRSYCFLDDAVEGTVRLMESIHRMPINVGSDRMISVNNLVTLVENIAGYSVQRDYLPDEPQGVRGRNADLTRCRKLLGWEPQVALPDGMTRLYSWVEEQVAKTL